jgi:hypothetical protein
MLKWIMRAVVLVLTMVVSTLTLAGSSAAQPPSPFVTRNGTTLSVDGHGYRFDGISANQLATYWAVNWGCGSQVDDLDGFFASLHPGSMVSFAGMQAMAFNNKPLSKPANVIDFTGIDRVVRAAERHGQKLSIGLADQQGTCDDGHWKGKAWYDGGYRRVFNDDGRNLDRLSYWDYIHLIVPRYKNSTAVAIWGLMGEPEASNCQPGYVGGTCYSHLTCPAGATSSLRRFFDTVGAEVKRMDPNHLIASGTLSRAQCGLSGGGYATVAASPYIDIMSFHDYGNQTIPIPSDLRKALRQVHAANKVFDMDEAGIPAGNGCESTTQRRDQFKAKMDAQFKAGETGFMIWNWELAAPKNCDFGIAPNDPVMRLLLTYRVPA